MLVYPLLSTTQLWLKTADAVFRSIGAEPDAGRRLVSWARQAGYKAEQVSFSSSTLGSGGQPGMRYWGNMWAERVAAEEWKSRRWPRVGDGKTGGTDEGGLVDAGETDEGVFVMLCGEVCCANENLSSMSSMSHGSEE